VTTNRSTEYYFLIDAGNLSSMQTVHYRFLANDTEGQWNTQMSYSSFVVQNRIPTVPSLTDEDNTHSASATLAWSSSTDDDEDAITYDIRIDTVDTGSSLGSWTDVSDTSKGTSSILSSWDTDYYWSVRACDNHGDCSDWATSDTFQRINAQPTTPSLISPSDYDNSTDNSPLLNWSSSSDADNDALIYYYEVDGNGDFSSPEHSGSTSDTHVTIPSIADGEWNWRVFASDQMGASDENSSASSSRVLIVDTTGPLYSSVVNSEAIGERDVTVNCTWTDTLNTVDSVFLESNFTGTLTNYTVTTSEGDKYYFLIESGNLSNAQVVKYRFFSNDSLDNFNNSMPFSEFTVTSLPPDVVINSPVLFYNTSSDALSVNATVTDQFVSVETVRYRWENSSTNSSWNVMTNDSASEFTANLDISSLTDGEYAIRIWANNSASLVNQTESVNFTIDRTGPQYTITIVTPTIDVTPNVTFTTDERANCTYRTDYSPSSYTLMATTGATSHSHNLPTQNFTMTSLSNTLYSYILNEDYYTGIHTVYANCTDELGNSRTSSTSFEITYPRKDKIFYEPQDLVKINVSLESGSSVTADLSAIDSGFNSSLVTVSDNSDNTYQINHTLSSGNTKSAGQYSIPVTGGGINSTLFMYYQPSWGWEQVYNSLLCYAGHPGWYFDESSCTWYDILFAVKKMRGLSVESDCEDGADNDNDGLIDCSDKDCYSKFYTCRTGTAPSGLLPA